MMVMKAVNAHHALPYAVSLLSRQGIRRGSRNGPVLQYPEPVTTVYENPLERVLFWPQRDANPFLHLYESLWMLAGRNDIAPLIRYAKNFENYTDDGVTQHGAYGHRWRNHFGIDQLTIIAQQLIKNPDDRRCVLQMWDARADLGRNGKDVPCNTIATFQVTPAGELDMTVFCRSNDIIWGAYGANAVHFGFLLEFMGLLTDLPVGTYRQVSINWHGYVDTPAFQNCLAMAEEVYATIHTIPVSVTNPYDDEVHYLPLIDRYGFDTMGSVEMAIGHSIEEVLTAADTGFAIPLSPVMRDLPFFNMAHRVLLAHHIWKTATAPARYDEALAVLAAEDMRVDWVRAAYEWIERRQTAWMVKHG